MFPYGQTHRCSLVEDRIFVPSGMEGVVLTKVGASEM